MLRSPIKRLSAIQKRNLTILVFALCATFTLSLLSGVGSAVVHQLPLVDFARATISEIFANRTAPTLSPPVAAGLPVSENFDGMGTLATATLSADFKADKNDTTVRLVGTYAAAGTATERVGGAGLAANASAGIYNFGSGTTTTGVDRAVGFLSTSSATKSGNLYVHLANNSGTNYSGLKISYDVEKYRNGSNPAGYSMQMYYSTDGSIWTSAGANFLTSFSADADNLGFSPAPGATTSVTNKVLSQTVNNGSNFYLAWNYSVTSGTTTTNAQALAIDNISIQGANTISGTLFNSGGSPITAGRTIKLIKNGSITGTAISNSSGVYSFSGVSLASGDRIGVFVDGASEKGATVTLSGTSNITNFDLTQNRVSVRTDNSGSPAITNGNLGELDSSKDSDIPFTVSSGTLTVSVGVDLWLNFGGKFAPGGDINAGGNWMNNGTFTAGSFTVTLNGTSNQTIGGVSNSFFNTLTINNSGTSPNNVVSLAMNTNVANLLTVSAGVFDQNVGGNSSSLITTGNATNVVVVAPGGTWRNLGTGGVTLSGGVSNSGLINFNSNGATCNDPDSILIRSSDSGSPTPTRRTWSGNGSYLLIDVDVKDQATPGLPPPAFILVRNGTNSGNNSSGWIFDSACLSGTYTWIGNTPGGNTDWQVATNWTPTRTTTNVADVLLFDGGVTPGPTVTNVPTQEIAALRLINGVNGVTLNASADGNTLMLTGGTGKDFSVTAGSLLMLSGSNALNILVTGSNQGPVDGQIILQGGGHRLLGGAGQPNPPAINFSSGSIFTASTGFTGNPFGTGTNGSVVFDTGSSGFFNAGGDPFGGDGHSVVVFNLNSSATFNAESALSCSNPALSQGRSYGNLVLDNRLGGSTSYSCSGAFSLTVLNNLTIQSGRTFTLSGSTGGNLILDGNLTDNGTFDPNNRTVEFRGGGATQTISKPSGAESFFDVFTSLTAGGSVKLLSPVTIAHELNLNTSDSVLELNGKILTLNGTVTGAGGLKGDTGAILTVGGAGALGTLNFVSGAQTLGSMTVNRTSSGSVTLGNDLTVGGATTLTDGVVNMGSFTLALNGSVTRTSGYIIGNEMRNFVCSSVCVLTFDVGSANGYSPFAATYSVGQVGSYNQTVRAVEGKHPNISGTNALKRYWTLTTPMGPGSVSADVTFHYPAGDVGAGTESLYKLFRYNGGFTQFTPDVLNTSQHFATKNGVGSFSDWTLAEPAAINLPALGNYADASVDVGGNITVTPSATPTNTTSINVSTSSNFKGTLSANPSTGVVRITDAHPAGTYPIDVTAFNSGTGPTTKTFTLTVTTPTTCNPPSFAPGVGYSVGPSPSAVAVGDFNGDGIQDLVTTNLSAVIPPRKVSVLLGDGSGGFGGANHFDAGSGPQAVAVGDINGDGNQDLAIANQTSSEVSILLGDGSGGFAGPMNLSVGSTPFSIVMADLNGDGKPDLATANFTSSGSVSILLGDGNGNFTTNTIAVSSFLISIAVGQLNNDSFPDLIVADNADKNATVLLGNGTGGFSAGGTFSLGGRPQKITLGDFNNDNKLDLVSANNFGPNGVSVLLGDGAGSFGSFTSFSTGSNTLAVAVGDFNGDGNQDIAAANLSSSDVSILFGDGAGSFSASTQFAVPGGPHSVAVGDFNADGKQDLVFASQGSDKATVLLRQCPPTLGAYANPAVFLSGNTTVAPGFAPTNTVRMAVSTATDFKGSLSVNPATGLVRVTNAHRAGVHTVTVTAYDSAGVTATTTFTLTVNGPPTCNPISFRPATDYTTALSPAAVVVGDFNGDGKQDLVSADVASDKVSVFLGDGLGAFGGKTDFATGTGPNAVAVGDVNGDGKIDLAVANQQASSISILLGDGAGGFGIATDFSVGSTPSSIAVGDFNGDGRQDLTTANFISSGTVSVLLGDGAGGFGAATNFGVGGFPISVAVGDFNNDGKVDIAAGNNGDGTVSVLVGDGAGSFTGGGTLGLGGRPQWIAIGKFNHDNNQDLVTANNTGSALSVLLGNGAGGFGSVTNFNAGTNTVAVEVGDINGDGNQDLIATNLSSNNLSVLLGNGAGNFGTATNFSVGGPRTTVVGDFDGDGKQDLAVTRQGADHVAVLLRQCPPTLTNNTGITVNEGSTGNTITSTNLRVSDVDNTDAQLTYMLGTAPTHGTLKRSGSALGTSGTFTQTDINGNLLNYDHDGSETTSDGFTFTVSDGTGGSIGSATFNITVTPVNDNPTLTTNAGLTMGTGSTEAIDNTNLLASDPDNTAAQLTFTVGTAPAHGTLKKSGSNLSGGGTFTQDDINNNRITYVHNGDTASSDSFTFTVSDGAGGTIGSTTFNITINCTSNPVTTNTNDSGAGSLRDAIISACVGSTIAFDATAFNPAGGPYTITLTSGELAINKNLTITGVAPDRLTISGNTASRVFNIQSGTVAIADLTIANGTVTGGDDGGGVLNSGTLTLTNCNLFGNKTAHNGGGIYNSGASLTLTNCEVGGSPNGPQKNVAFIGGGLYNNNGTLKMTGGSIAGNSGDGLCVANGSVTLNGVAVTSNATINDGGGITAIGGTTNIINSSITGNATAPAHGGGGISMVGGTTTVAVVNSTISGNTGYHGGGGILNLSGTITLTNGTISNNRMVAPIFGGGGIYANGTVTLRNTIVAGNLHDGSNTADDISGTIVSSSSFNLVGAGGAGGLTDGPNNNQVGVPNPGLGALANNSGPTQTHALLPGSPAINAGSNALLPADTLDLDGNSNTTEPLPVDQRGVGFPRVISSTVDIGAVEYTKVNQTILFNSLASKTFGDPDFTVSATANSGLPVSFNASGNCTVTSPSPGTAHLTGAGSCTITASQSGDANNYNAATSIPQTFNITKAFATMTVTSSDNPSDLGQSVNFTATVSSSLATPTGSVQFKIDNGNFGPPVILNPNGQATSLSTVSPTFGPHVVAAEYSGDGNFNPGIGTLSGGQVVNPQPSLSINDVSITEGDTGTRTLTFTVTLSAASSLQVKVDFATANGTATAPSDYTAIPPTTLVFAPGVLSQPIGLTINGDQGFEPDETFLVNLTNPINATISDNQGVGSIFNDDAEGGIISFSQSNYSVNESGRLITVTINRTGDTSASATVGYATPDDSESSTVVSCATTNGFASPRCDFTSALGTLRFAANETSKTFTVLISQDNYVEGPESLTLNLSNLTGGAVLGAPSTAIVTIADDITEPATNPIDDAQNFVRQHYHDFLNREPDTDGLSFWTNEITSCGSDPRCIEVKRINVSAAFYRSIEFQDTGHLVERIYKAAYGDGTGTSRLGGAHPFPLPIIRFNEFLPDTQQIGQGVVVRQTGWETVLDNNKAAFAAQFVQRSRFTTEYANTLTPSQFVDMLFANTGVTPSSTDRQAAIDEFGGAGTSTDAAARGRALRRVAENKTFAQSEFNRAFVLMQYFGYLRRNPNVAPDSDYSGYDFWLTKLNQFNGNFVNAEMVKAFIISAEYRHRFGS